MGPNLMWWHDGMTSHMTVWRDGTRRHEAPPHLVASYDATLFDPMASLRSTRRNNMAERYFTLSHHVAEHDATVLYLVAKSYPIGLYFVARHNETQRDTMRQSGKTR